MQKNTINKMLKTIAILLLGFITVSFAATVVCAEKSAQLEQAGQKEAHNTVQVSKNEIQHEGEGREVPNPNNKEGLWGKASFYISTVSTVILAILTGIYVFLTFRILSEMRTAKDPAIEIDFEVKVNTLHETFVWVKNAGLSPAKNINIDVDDKLPLSHLYELKDTSLSEANFIKNSIPYLAPGRSKKYVVGNLKLNRERWGASDYIVNFDVTFENMNSKIQNVKMSIDVLQCIDPVVFRGQETLGAGYEVRLGQEP